MNFERIKLHLQPASGKQLLIGFSGGADSTSLLLLARRYQVELNYQLEAIHFEHGIRGTESKDDAAWSENFCRRLGIKFLSIDLSVPMRKLPGENLEGAARRMRLEHFQKLSQQYQQPVIIALGHHLDDRIETFFMRMSRGSNLSALLTPRPLAEINKLTIIRPLIDCTRHEVEQFLNSEKIFDYRTDSTNYSVDYQRNYLRNELLPEIYENIANSRNGIIRTLEVLNLDVDFIEQQSAKEFTSISGKIATPLSFWRNLHVALRIRILRHHLAEFNGCDSPLDGALIERFNQALAATPDGTKIIPVNGRMQIEIRNDECRLVAAVNAAASAMDSPTTPETTSRLAFRKHRRSVSEIADKE
ncbi:MAG: tRNA lysidine(34) synthetase TilS, partial [Victivallaceae bacterium]